MPLSEETGGGDSLLHRYSQDKGCNNVDGIRISKTVDGVEHQYILDGTRLLRESWGNNWVAYFYDENGVPLYMIRYDVNVGFTQLNFFVTNLQGDVIAVCDNTHVPRFFYHYDAWGKLLSVTNTNGDDVTNATNAASWNSLRYRGYVYDRETGLYYLNSRYYDPETGRFISADGVISDVGGVIQGNNMYTYCFNNPVNMTDANGNWPNWDKLVKGALLVTIGALAVAAVVSTGGACAPLVALGYSALGTAGAALTIIGSSEVGESITGANPIKESIGEDTYDTIRDASLAVVSMGGTLLDAGANAVCFVAGTEIRTDTGEVAIEDVAAGAIVWAMNPDTGEVALKKVVRTFVNETDELVHVKVSGEEIICTPSHPFYSPVKGWTKAGDLRAGDILVRLNGTYIIVEQVQHELLETPVRVYNFEVADFHTYFVGKEPVLVHNKCGDDFSTKYTKNYSANFSNEREARNFARTKVGHNPIQVADGKIRSANNVWQYRAKSGDIAKRHVHIEKLNPKTGEVLLNWHLRWGPHYD